MEDLDEKTTAWQATGSIVKDGKSASITDVRNCFSQKDCLLPCVHQVTKAEGSLESIPAFVLCVSFTSDHPFTPAHSHVVLACPPSGLREQREMKASYRILFHAAKDAYKSLLTILNPRFYRGFQEQQRLTGQATPR